MTLDSFSERRKDTTLLSPKEIGAVVPEHHSLAAPRTTVADPGLCSPQSLTADTATRPVQMSTCDTVAGLIRQGSVKSRCDAVRWDATHG